jgi:hypothetical protein
VLLSFFTRSNQIPVSLLIVISTFLVVSQAVEEEGLVEAVRWEEVEGVLPWAEAVAGALAAGVEGDSRIV